MPNLQQIPRRASAVRRRMGNPKPHIYLGEFVKEWIVTFPPDMGDTTDYLVACRYAVERNQRENRYG